MMSIFDPTRGSYSLGRVLLRRNTLYTLTTSAQSTKKYKSEDSVFGYVCGVTLHDDTTDTNDNMTRAHQHEHVSAQSFCVSEHRLFAHCTARLKSELCPSFHSSHRHAFMMCAVLPGHGTGLATHTHSMCVWVCSWNLVEFEAPEPMCAFGLSGCRVEPRRPHQKVQNQQTTTKTTTTTKPNPEQVGPRRACPLSQARSRVWVLRGHTTTHDNTTTTHNNKTTTTTQTTPENLAKTLKH